MRVLSFAAYLFLCTGVLTALPDDAALPDLVEEYLEHPDFISQGCCNPYPGRPCPCPDAPRKKLNTGKFSFEPPDDGNASPSGTYIFGSKKDANPTSNAESPDSPAIQKAKKRSPIEHATETSANRVGGDDEAEETLKQKHPYAFPPSSTAKGSIRGTSDKIFTATKDENLSPDVSHAIPQCSPSGDGFTVNFENIKVLELLQFISQISGVNFIFDAADLDFSISIISQEAASVIELTSALLQILKMHNLNFVEQGNTVLIYKEENLSKVSKVITDENIEEACDAAIITRVFRLNNVEPESVGGIVAPLLSKDAVVEISKETSHLIVSDLTYNVDRIAQLLNALDVPNTLFEVAEYNVMGGYPAALVAYAKEILAPLLVDNPMQMIAQPSNSKIFLVSTPYLIHKALQLLKSLDTADIATVADLPSTSVQANVMYMYKLKYQPGKDIADSLQTIGSNLQFAGVTSLELVNAVYSAQFIEVNNSIVITGTQEAVEKVVDLIDNLDMPPKQVFIEALVIDTTLTNALDFGVQWIGLGDEQDKLAYATGLLANQAGGGPNLQGVSTAPPGARNVAAGTGGTAPLVPNPGTDVSLPTPDLLQGFTSLSNLSEAFGFGIIGNIITHNGRSFLTLGALISALEQEQTSKLVLNPRIMCQDTQPADIFVGQNIPYQTTSSVIQQTGSVTQNIQYEDVGIQLQITPTIAPNNLVSMEINQTIAENISTTGTLTPTTSKTLTTTRLHVPDGCFLVMSGHIRDKVTSTRSGIPCLGSLPLIGPTFGRTVDQREKRNLIMFLRPKVMTNVQEELQLTNQEGYDYNWESNPDALFECGPKQAPECEVYPPYQCPPD